MRKHISRSSVQINKPKNSRRSKSAVEAERALPLHGSQPALLVPQNLIPRKHIDRGHTGMNHSSEVAIKDQAHK